MSTEGPIPRRPACDDAAGFTLVEILVVMLILGTLAAIAVPAYYSQVAKARDAQAKQHAQSAARAIESWALENAGDYSGATIGELEGIEPTLSEASLELSDLAEDSYTLAVTSEERRFEISRAADGGRTLSCEPSGAGGCGADGNWG